MHEIWKEIENYENYEISNFGNVRKKLKTSKTKDGYRAISLTDDFGNRKTLRVHRLVAKAFIEEEDGKFLVNHKDGIRDNNNVDNLEWCTPKENSQHSIKTNTFFRKTHNFTIEQKQEIYNMLKSGERIKDVSLKFNNITTSSIHYILENDFNIKDLKDLISQSRHHHTLEERKRIKEKIFYSGKNNIELSKELGISKQLVSKIKRELEWKDVEIEKIKEKQNNFAPTTGRTNDELIKIKYDIFNSNLTNNELAEKYSINQKTVRNIKKEKTWKLVPLLNNIE